MLFCKCLPCQHSQGLSKSFATLRSQEPAFSVPSLGRAGSVPDCSLARFSHRIPSVLFRIEPPFALFSEEQWGAATLCPALLRPAEGCILNSLSEWMTPQVPGSAHLSISWPVFQILRPRVLCRVPSVSPFPMMLSVFVLKAEESCPEVSGEGVDNDNYPLH